MVTQGGHHSGHLPPLKSLTLPPIKFGWPFDPWVNGRRENECIAYLTLYQCDFASLNPDVSHSKAYNFFYYTSLPLSEDIAKYHPQRDLFPKRIQVQFFKILT